MRAASLAILTLGSVLALSPVTAGAQQQNQGGGLGGAIDQLNRAINPDRERDDRDRRAREDERYRRDPQGGRDQSYYRDSRDRRSERGAAGSSTYDGDRSGSSASEDRRSPSYQRYSDQDLRDEAARLQREQRAVQDEMQRRGLQRR